MLFRAFLPPKMMLPKALIKKEGTNAHGAGKYFAPLSGMKICKILFTAKFFPGSGKNGFLCALVSLWFKALYHHLPGAVCYQQSILWIRPQAPVSQGIVHRSMPGIHSFPGCAT